MIIIIANKRRLLCYLCVFTAALLIGGGINVMRQYAVSALSETNPAYLAVIIDDFGNNGAGTNEMINLPIALTGAVMPSLPYTAAEAQLLHESGKDVILHMPMEPLSGKRSWLGPNAITSEMSNEDVRKNLINSLSEINHCVGINNHMGSKIMENERILNELFSVVDETGILFIDSKTTQKKTAKELSSKFNITYLERHVFLDSTNDISVIEKNLQKAGDVAIKNGYCIAIGHVGPDGGIPTVTALKNNYKKLEEKGIKFVTVSELAELLSERNTHL